MCGHTPDHNHTLKKRYEKCSNVSCARTHHCPPAPSTQRHHFTGLIYSLQFSPPKGKHKISSHKEGKACWWLRRHLGHFYRPRRRRRRSRRGRTPAQHWAHSEGDTAGSWQRPLHEGPEPGQRHLGKPTGTPRALITAPQSLFQPEGNGKEAIGRVPVSLRPWPQSSSGLKETNFQKSPLQVPNPPMTHRYMWSTAGHSGFRTMSQETCKLPDVWGKIDCDSNKNSPIQRKFKPPPC